MTRTTTGRLSVNLSNLAAGHVLTLDGQIDERCDLVSVAMEVSNAVTINLRDVSFINSIGVREWIKMLGQLESQHVRVTLQECSEALVHQFNMIMESRRVSEISSFFAPYECEDCGNEASMLLDVGRWRSDLLALEPPVLVCPECEGTMAFGDLAERYLLFLKC